MQEKIMEALAPALIGAFAALLAILVPKVIGWVKRVVLKTPTKLDDFALGLVLAAIEKGLIVKLPTEEKPVVLKKAK